MTELSVSEQPRFSPEQIQAAFKFFLQGLSYPVHANVLEKELEIFNAHNGADLDILKVVGVIEKTGRKVLNKDRLESETSLVAESVPKLLKNLRGKTT